METLQAEMTLLRFPVFDENTLPAGLRKEHCARAGVLGVIRVLRGKITYKVLEPASETVLDPDHPRFVLLELPHLVVPPGPAQMRVKFYDGPPWVQPE